MNSYHKDNILRVENITKEYDSKNIIENINIDLNQGEFVSILGPSGCGKSTLFNIISGLQRPDTGQVFVNGSDVTFQTGKVSYMHQKDLLLPWRNVVDNGILPLEIKGVKKEEARKKVIDMLPIFELEGDEKKYPNQLSGGMKQRVSLLRTYMFSKEIMLLDEPFGGLDAITRFKMQEYLLEVLSKIKGSVLFITHDIDESIFLSDRIYILNGAPAGIVAEFKVNLERPRNKEIVGTSEFNEIRTKILKLL